MKTILAITDYYLPGYKGGGPIRTIANTVDWLSDEFTFRIITRDRDLSDAQAYPNIKRGEWMPVGKAQVCYLAPVEQNPITLRALLRQMDYDALYFNSFFSSICVKTMFAHRYGRIPQKPVLIAPRNEFFPAALRLKRAKKQVYLRVVKLVGMYRNIIWQASSDYEAERIKAMFPGAETIVAPNLSAKTLPALPNLLPKPSGGPLRVIFLSRISRKKNLDYALRVLKQIKSDIVFDIYGPKEDTTLWDECEQLIKVLPPNVTASYKGELSPDQVIETFSRYHLFLFPTRGENYGHVIWESLYAGCPVLLSDQTPWRDLADKGVGWDLPLNAPERFARIVDDVTAMDQKTHSQYARAAQSYAQNVACDDAVLAANRRMFNTLLNRQG